VAATQESPELIRARILLGDLFRAEGNYKAALDEYETVVKLDPYSPSGFYRLGLAYQFLQRFLEAKDAYKKALELKEDDADSHMNLGLVYLALGDPEQAVIHTKRAIEIAPSSPDALANYGVVLDVIGDHVGAQRALLSSLEISGDKPATLLNLAQNLLGQGRGREAQEVLERFFKTSDSPIARKRMGDAMALQGLAADAVAEYERAIKLDPNYFPALNEAGRVIIQRYRAGNELDESLRLAALGYWGRSLSVNPNQPTIRALQTQWSKSRP
jgi:tetratricopeptide (TPR) repeat protein